MILSDGLTAPMFRIEYRKMDLCPNYASVIVKSLLNGIKQNIRVLYSAFAILGTGSLCACGSSVDVSNNGSSSDSQVNISFLKNNENDKLVKLMSGRRLEQSQALSGNPFVEYFYEDYSWSGWFAQIDVMEYAGNWEVAQHHDGNLRLCVDVVAMNGEKFEKSQRHCRVFGQDGQGDIYTSKLFEGGNLRPVEVSPIE
ncbi:hypothetical protein [Alteriqipengyuania sp. 357]